MRIPTYDSGVTPTVKTASPISGASPIGEAIQGVGSILGQVSEGLTKAEVLRQVNAADLKRKELFNKISESARLDTNSEGFDERRKTELQEGLPTVTEGLKHPLAKQQFEPYLSKSVMDFAYGLHMEGVKLLNNDLIAKTKEGIDDPEKGYLQQYYKETDPAKKKEIADTMVLAIKGLGDVGAITRPQEKDWVYNTLDLLGEGQFNYDLGVDPDATLLRVQQNYYTKDPKIKRQYENMAKSSINANKQVLKEVLAEQKKQALNDQMIKIIEGTFDPSEPVALLKNNIIDSKDYDNLIERNLSGTNVTDYAVYSELNNRINSINNYDNNQANDSQKVIDDLLAFSRKLSNSDLKQLLDRAKSEVSNQDKAMIKNEADSLKAWCQQHILPEEAWELAKGKFAGQANNLLYEYHRRVAEENAVGDRIEEIKREVISAYVYKNNLSPNIIPQKIEERRQQEVLPELKQKSFEQRYKELETEAGHKVDKKKIFDQLLLEGY